MAQFWGIALPADGAWIDVDLLEFPLGPRTEQENQLTARKRVRKTEVKEEAMNTKSARPSENQGDTMKRLTLSDTATARFGSAMGPMKRLATVALMLVLAVATAYAHDDPVTLTFSGVSDTSPDNLQQPDTSNDGDNFAGDGTLGKFNVRLVRAISNTAGSSSTCAGPDQLFLTELAGGGVFRFEDGSLLNVNLTQGGDCINLTTGVAHCTLTFQVTGGTGRFKSASGVLTMTETVNAVLFDALGNPLVFDATGQFTGTVSGVAKDEDRPAERQ
jgi:hypothetical protein